jgi:D-tyrosyl-tRNA(Tyr) deacylase
MDGREVAAIGPGLVALVGFSAGETAGPQLERLARRLVQLRIFDDAQGRLNRSLQDVQGELLLIPQITLTASLESGNRPSFHTAAPAAAAGELFASFVKAVRTISPKVQAGVFQAHMIVSLENDGPVTFVLDER